MHATPPAPNASVIRGTRPFATLPVFNVPENGFPAAGLAEKLTPDSRARFCAVATTLPVAILASPVDGVL